MIKAKILSDTGTNIPFKRIHQILKNGGYAVKEPKKSKQHKWVRYEREHTNSMWHTDYKQLDDGRWFIAYSDDASRLITGFGVFDEATSAHAIDVLHKAIAKHGKPASVLTDHGSQFFANAGEYKKAGLSRSLSAWE